MSILSICGSPPAFPLFPFLLSAFCFLLPLNRGWPAKQAKQAKEALANVPEEMLTARVGGSLRMSSQKLTKGTKNFVIFAAFC